MKSQNTPLAFILVFASFAYASVPEFFARQQVGTVEQAAINEASGLVASTMNRGVLWTHNDSGDSARVFAMDFQGHHLGIYYIGGAGATDWEDITLGPGPVDGVSYLYAGDIGDNNAVRSYVKVYRVAEPTVTVGQSPEIVTLSGMETIRLTYPDGARDAETLMIDPLTRDIYIVSKRESQSRVYRAGYPQSTTQTTVMEYLGELPWGWAVGGDISPDGAKIIIRGYTNASIWLRPDGGSVWDAFAAGAHSVPLSYDGQGEAICFDHNSLGYFTVAEGTSRPIYYYARDILPGDANEDDEVDVGDLGILAFNYNMTTGGVWQSGDFNDDGTVDISDLGILAANYSAGDAEVTDFQAAYASTFGDKVQNDSNLCSLIGLPLIASFAMLMFGKFD